MKPRLAAVWASFGIALIPPRTFQAAACPERLGESHARILALATWRDVVLPWNHVG